MTDYVSKEELRKFFEGIVITVGGRTRAEAISEVLQAVYNGVMGLPTTDAVHVIICRDCKHALPQGKYGDWFICEMWDKQIHTSLNGYCYKAERKEKGRPYDPIWDMYLDEFEDDKDVSTSAERKEE